VTIHDSANGLLGSLPRAVRGNMTLRIVTADGEISRPVGEDDGSRVRVRTQGLVVEPGEGRSVFQHALADSGSTAVMSIDEDQRDAVVPFLDGLFALLEQNQLIEEDMESIQPSSLALLEEVSMYNDTLPQLSTGSSELAIAEMGLSALVVAASLNRAVYVRYHEATERCEVLVQVVMDEERRRPVRVPFTGEPAWGSDDGIVWRAIRGNGDAILESVPPGGRLGTPASPEWFAEREIIAVPVTCGHEDSHVTLGALLIMDKQANAYSTSVHLGSQETKFAIAIASMVGSVLGARKVAQIDKELRLAEEIQQQILPDRPARVEGFDLAGRCLNYGAVGGDYFDFLPMGDGRTLVVVADVSGHNLASGMLMVNARSTLKTIAAGCDDLAVVFDRLAGAMYHDLTRTELFITAVAVALRPGSREVDLVNAGHNDSMVYRAKTGEVERFPSEGTILGFLPDDEHDLRRATLDEDDVLLLYTDGVVEATDPGGEMLGEERLAEMLREAAEGTASEVLEAVFGAVAEFSNQSPKTDDVTAVVIKVVPRAPEEASGA